MKLVIITSVLFVLGCNQQEGILFQLDMSLEHDEGRFNPENGDVVSIAGHFNDWEPGLNNLEDLNGDWIYEIRLKEVPDTLEYKFLVSSTSNLDLPNSGWEIIPNRSITQSEIASFNPIFTFNEPWKPSKLEDVLFAVSMSNQEVLEFFDPEKDKVVVSGTFIDWDPSGIELEDSDKDGVYELEVPIEVNPVKPHYFKYRMVKGKEFAGYIPNSGWETVDDRVLISENNEFEYFNDQIRVSRFLINSDWLESQSPNGIERSDIFQIRFYIGEESYLSESLVKKEDDTYETSVAIPMTVDKVKWVVVKNQSIELGEIKEDVVTHKGAVLIVK